MKVKLLGARWEVRRNISEILPRLYSFGVKNSERNDESDFENNLSYIAVYLQEGYGFEDQKGEFELGFQFYGTDEDGDEYEMDALTQSFCFYASPNTYQGNDFAIQDLIDNETRPNAVKCSHCAALYALLCLGEKGLIDKQMGGIVEDLIDKVFDLNGKGW